MSVSIKVEGLSEAEKFIAGYNPKTIDRKLQAALLVAARKVARSAIRAEAPRGKTGNMARKVTVRRGKRDTPSVVVGSRVRYAHLVIGGTRPHRIRFHDQVVAGMSKDQGNIQHPGARANPFVARAQDRAGDEAQRVFEEAFFAK